MLIRTSSVNSICEQPYYEYIISNVRLQRVASEMEKEFNVHAFIIHFTIREEA